MRFALPGLIRLGFVVAAIVSGYCTCFETRAQSPTATFSLVDVTNAPPPDGSYNQNGFIHGLNKWTFDLVYSNTGRDELDECGVLSVAFSTAWYYSGVSTDPNAPPLATAPGTAGTNRFSTFVSNPVSQFANARFTTSTKIYGGYLDPGPEAGPTFLNLIWGQYPPVYMDPVENLGILRLTLDTSMRPDISGVAINGPGELLGRIVIEPVTARTGSHVAVFTLNAVPEPGAFSLLGLALAVRFLARQRWV